MAAPLAAARAELEAYLARLGDAVGPALWRPDTLHGPPSDAGDGGRGRARQSGATASASQLRRELRRLQSENVALLLSIAALEAEGDAVPPPPPPPPLPGNAALAAAVLRSAFSEAAAAAATADAGTNDGDEVFELAAARRQRQCSAQLQQLQRLALRAAGIGGDAGRPAPVLRRHAATQTASGLPTLVAPAHVLTPALRRCLDANRGAAALLHADVLTPRSLALAARQLRPASSRAAAAVFDAFLATRLPPAPPPAPFSFLTQARDEEPPLPSELPSDVLCVFPVLVCGPRSAHPGTGVDAVCGPGLLVAARTELLLFDAIPRGNPSAATTTMSLGAYDDVVKLRLGLVGGNFHLLVPALAVASAPRPGGMAAPSALELHRHFAAVAAAAAASPSPSPPLVQWDAAELAAQWHRAAVLTTFMRRQPTGSALFGPPVVEEVAHSVIFDCDADIARFCTLLSTVLGAPRWSPFTLGGAGPPLPPLTKPRAVRPAVAFAEAAAVGSGGSGTAPSPESFFPAHVSMADSSFCAAWHVHPRLLLEARHALVGDPTRAWFGLLDAAAAMPPVNAAALSFTVGAALCDFLVELGACEPVLLIERLPKSAAL